MSISLLRCLRRSLLSNRNGNHSGRRSASSSSSSGGGKGHAHEDHPHSSHSSHAHYDTNFYSTVKPHQPNKIHEYIGTALGATMWFWVFWRAKHDLPHLLGFHHPWDHMDHDQHHHEEHQAQH